MKILKTFLFGVLCFIIISNLFVNAVEDEDWERNYFGKVVGWILDPVTNKPVNEEFYIRFYFINSEDPDDPVYLDAKSNDKGFFTRKLYPGKYYVYAWPVVRGNYCIMHSPLLDTTKANVLDIKNGQITRMYKKAEIGGDLLVILVDPNGQKINIDEVFKGKKFSVSISNKVTHVAVNIDNKINPSNDRREFYFNNYAPGEYIVEFNTIAGVAGQRIKNITIKKNETTVHHIIIDIYTGIEGTVTNVNGLPMKSVGIEIRSNTYPTFFSEVFTNSNGYFKLIGMKDGSYNIDYFIEVGNDGFYGGEIRNITVKKGLLTTKNIIFKMVKIE
jgi:hypothetical protein